jgi:uncharacterized protein (TIGR02266 family)
MAHQDDDRRKFQRMEVLLKVEYKEPKDLLNDYITNLGEGGMFIHTNLPLQEGQRLSFSLSFPGLLEPILLDGVVRWRREPIEHEPGEPVGLGVEFIFSDDKQKARVDELVTAFQEEPTPLPDDVPPPFRVLLVEDNTFAMELFDYAIRRFHTEQGVDSGLEVLHAGDAYEALRQLEQSSIDLAIVDHFLPGMTGCELVFRMRQDNRTQETPILVVSVGGETVRQEAYSSGANLYLDKPVLHKQLIVTITKLLTWDEMRE